MILFTLLISTLLQSSYAISVRMDKHRNFYCYKVETNYNSVLEGSYLISGEDEDKTTIRVSTKQINTRSIIHNMKFPLKKLIQLLALFLLRAMIQVSFERKR